MLRMGTAVREGKGGINVGASERLDGTSSPTHSFTNGEIEVLGSEMHWRSPDFKTRNLSERSSVVKNTGCGSDRPAFEFHLVSYLWCM